MKRTAVIGATTNPSRYAFIAAEMLVEYGIDIVLLGIKKGQVAGQDIQDIRNFPDPGEIHTVTLYLGPANQVPYYDYILSLKPKRIIFNPGTENPEFERMARERDIEVDEACTLVMLRVGLY
ncbi:CoA-binding protein [Fulvivirga sedimenti]|jgi:predicted CoA-binding protein|uniref:CoA-binding protein n=1 Tax=Fulvivirga sedimenti TaxID=2879465 RepID=A0A9X1HNT1_9BACT|nr:CoA-binding protein [Fulvivirga sedimenti]MCA6073387.1 CoA-binding protein [Fulvivirga sedimenti]